MLPSQSRAIIMVRNSSKPTPTFAVEEASVLIPWRPYFTLCRGSSVDEGRFPTNRIHSSALLHGIHCSKRNASLTEQFRFAASRNKLNLFNKQTFSQPKVAGATRIFCLGGSTTFGRPYDDTTSFAGWLREFAAAADSEGNYEIINAGGVSYASCRVARLVEELVGDEPNLFICYTGHNEFIEHRTYRDIHATPELVRNTGSLLSRTRVYSTVRRLYGTMATNGAGTPSNATMLSSDIEAIPDQTVGPQSYERNNRFQAQVLAHFEEALNRIVDIAATAGADVIFVDPASNLKDYSPFKNQHRSGLSEKNWHRVP